MANFTAAWLLFGIGLLGLAIVVGRAATGRWAGVLIDGRGRYSLTHLQTVFWTLMILSSYLGVVACSSFNLDLLKIDSSLLQLLGITAGSAVIATGVKGIKDAPGSGAGDIAREGANVTRPDNSTIRITAKLSQIWLEEEGALADRVVSITKFQNLIFTLVALAVYAALVANDHANGLPKLPDNLVWLLGISHAGYVGGKIPDKA